MTIKRFLFGPFVAVCLVLGAPCHTTAQTQARIPLEDFFVEADMRSLQLSPDGRYLAFLTTLGTGKVGIALMHLDTGKVEALVAAKDENYKSYFWKGSDYIVYGGDIGGAESPAWRSIDIPKRHVVALSEAYRELTSDDANFINIRNRLRFDPYHFMGSGRKDFGSSSIGMYLVDVRDGTRTPVGSYEPSTADETEFLADNNGVLRVRSYYEGKSIVFEVRPQPTDRFVKVAEFPANDPKWEWRFFAADNETLYLVSTEKSDTGTLYAYNVRTRQLGAPLFHSPDGEIDSVLSSYDLTKLYGVTYTTDKTYYHFTDPARARLQNTIDNSLPGTTNIIISESQDEKIMVVAATSDRTPGSYYLLDLRNPRLMLIGKVNGRIKPEQMRPMEPVQYVARDGLTIHGYLTRPAGSEGKPVPLIIHPHGGPYGIRDDWGFDGEVQFLANRGYAVLQINYRGSGGYGYAFQKAGQREWGGKMQDDLTDGVKWAIAQGITDAAHVGIYGASYGGYATLAGLTFTPELYRCGANYVGVSDLGLITSWGDFRRSGRGTDMFYREWVGDDAQYKHDRSPVNFVDRIRVPLLNAYGYNDRRVEIKNWTRLESKLKEYNKTYEIMIMGNEGHGFYNEGNRIDFYRRLEAFLDKYMWDGPAGHVEMREPKVIEMPVKEKP
jgi:dipeptidyl aminopeptidase/acylaminoacyl peptidase